MFHFSKNIFCDLQGVLYYLLIEMALVYSCCFWFSLRLGGILIGLLSAAIAVLIGCCLVYIQSEVVKEQFTEWTNHLNLLYLNEFMANLLEDPQKYVSLAIVCKCVYLVTCVIYIYGAYICSNILMMSYIILELFRLILISAVVATGLLLLKQNTMDIGSLIGASVLGGFFLLGMFYLWVCAATLPILINEMERDDQAATIAKLEQLLEANQRPRRGFDNVRYGLPEDPPFSRDLFIVSHKNKVLDKSVRPSRIPVAY